MKLYREETLCIIIVLFSICETMSTSNKEIQNSIYETSYIQRSYSSIQYIQPGKPYRINNPNFPNRYPSFKECSWYLSTQNGYRIHMTCSNVELPSDGENCEDYLQVHTTDNNTTDTSKHCTPFSVQGTSITMNLVTSSESTGGIFSCDVISEEPDQIEDCNCGWTYKDSTSSESGNAESRIVNGTDAGVNEFPSMVLTKRNNEQWCGGTILSEKAVLTAAHCFELDSNPDNYTIIVGEHDLRTEEETDATKTLKVSRIIVHSDYKKKVKSYDIALMIPFENIVFTPKVGPTCLPFNIDASDIEGQYVTVTGWGRIDHAGPLADVLQVVRLQVVPESRCESAYGDSYIAGEHFCTYTPGKDACLYDSGGPAYYFTQPNDKFVQVGIVSYGNGCATEVPGVFVNVHYYLEWIMEMLPDEEFCNI